MVEISVNLPEFNPVGFEKELRLKRGDILKVSKRDGKVFIEFAVDPPEPLKSQVIELAKRFTS